MGALLGCCLGAKVRSSPSIPPPLHRSIPHPSIPPPLHPSIPPSLYPSIPPSLPPTPAQAPSPIPPSLPPSCPHQQPHGSVSPGPGPRLPSALSRGGLGPGVLPARSHRPAKPALWDACRIIVLYLTSPVVRAPTEGGSGHAGGTRAHRRPVALLRPKREKQINWDRPGLPRVWARRGDYTEPPG